MIEFALLSGSSNPQSKIEDSMKEIKTRPPDCQANVQQVEVNDNKETTSGVPCQEVVMEGGEAVNVIS